MRLVILTSARRGYASRCLPVLCGKDGLRVEGVIFSRNAAPASWGMVMRKIRKTARIGFLGALNGVRLRDWYKDRAAEDIWEVCNALSIEITETDYTNCRRTRELFRHFGADLGLSLGNGYISRYVFSIPRYGMINVHTEILPRFQGAHSIVWPIYEGIPETGFTIHQVDSHIDTGPILFQEKYPIEFRGTLRETIEVNLEKARKRVPEAVTYLCENYERLRTVAKAQEPGERYATPTIRQFLRMVRNNKKLALHQNAC